MSGITKGPFVAVSVNDNSLSATVYHIRYITSISDKCHRSQGEATPIMYIKYEWDIH